MTSASPRINRWRAFALLAVAYFMTIIDLTIVNVSLPTIGRDLHFTDTSLQWVATAYGLTFGGFLLFGGRAADLLGRRRILMAGLAVFTAASLACALASTDAFLIASRAVQGLGAAFMLPAALSIVMNMFEEGAERNKALGIWGGLGAAGATVGLIAGGFLTRYAGWQYIFYLNVPIGAAALALAPRVVPESRSATTRRRFDVAGAITSTGGLVLLVDAISQAPQYGWGATRTVGVLSAAVALLAAFVVIESRVSEPILPLSIFRQRTLAGANVAGSAARRQLLRVHLRRHAVHAAGPALQRAADRGRVAGRFADVDRARRRLAAAGHARRGEARDGRRHDADRRGHHLGHPGPRSRPLPGEPRRADGASPAPAPRSRSSRSRSPRSPASRSAAPGWRRGCSTPPSNSAERSGSRSPRASPRAIPRRWRTRATPFRWRSPAASSTRSGCSGRSR